MKNAEIRATKSDECVELKIAVVSDIHAYDTLISEKEAPSFLCTNDPENQINNHPIAGLINLIETEEIQTDLLLCCGDMGDKARPNCISYTWNKLHLLRDKLKARNLFVTPGNHDVDSRFSHNDFDAKGFLQSLTPSFPFEEERLNDRFWARNYVVLTEQDCRIVILNTSAYHGHKEGEFEHGRVAARTIEALKMDLENLEKTAPRQVNILLCHHHPHNHGDVEEKDPSLMEGGNNLLKFLGAGDYGSWIVIHGHKHHPRISYAAGSAAAPIVFSAGSLCASLYAALQAQARNQFYTITFPLAEFDNVGLGLIGRFQAWDWIVGRGWQKATPNSGLPSKGGFGNRGDITTIARNIASFFSTLGQPYSEWSEIESKLPGVLYLLPENLENVINKLESNFKLRVTRDKDGNPSQIGRVV